MSNTDSITYPAVNKTLLNSFCAPAEEEFRPVHIPHFAHLYHVSQYGRVKRVSRPSCLRPMIGKHGYPHVALQYYGIREDWYVHRLVAYVFLGAPAKEDYEIAHWDGDPSNSAVSNLRWASKQENVLDKWRHGTMPAGEKCVTAKLRERDAIQIHADYRAGKTIAEIAKSFAVCKRTVSLILHGKTWKCIKMTTEMRGHKRSPVLEKNALLYTLAS